MKSEFLKTLIISAPIEKDENIMQLAYVDTVYIYKIYTRYFN